MRMFFAKDKKSAVKRLKEIEADENVCYSSPKLAKKQVKHIAGWKTFNVNKVRCKRRK